MSAYPASIRLSDLDGSNGFRLNGQDVYDRAGCSVASAGDVNGDGIADIIIGAVGAGLAPLAGAAYVVFGRAGGFNATLDLGDLDGADGFRLDGVNIFDLAGSSVSSAGDVNGDGYDDIIVGAPGADGTRQYAGQSYVVFGKAAGFAASWDVSELNGVNGFRIDGARLNDTSGQSVSSAGDLNGDGFDDLIIGAPDVGDYQGAAYVVFGRAAGFNAVLSVSDLDGENGFRILGVGPDNRTGATVASGGDVNGDGIDDIIVGAVSASVDGLNYAGAAYVIFGRTQGFGANFNLGALDGQNGFRLVGQAAFDQMESVASAGDVNGDGYDDIITGAHLADSGQGAAYVVFGAAGGFAPSLSAADLDGVNGFRMEGAAAFDYAGWSVASAGDFNGDGFGDVIVAAQLGDVGSEQNAGVSYVLFGKASGFDAVIDLGALDGSNGLRLDGVSASDLTSSVGSAGDVNGDGLSDLVIGAQDADPNEVANAGSSYVVYGMLPAEAVIRTGSIIGQTIHGGAFDDALSGLGGGDTLIGNNGADGLQGGSGADTLFGGVHNDTLTGGNGHDVMNGGAGKDILTGGKGGDILKGGSGSDVFVYKKAGDSVGDGADRITDLNAADTIDLSRIDADTGAAGNQAFVLAAAFTGVAGQLVRTYIAGQNQTLIQGDTNGDGVAELTIIADGGDFSGFAGFAL